jgi:eukaryotic-like serine/threonine-protein kinase
MEKGIVLESWKSISAHLRRNIRTCQHWEREHGLPIHRLDGSPKAHVFAYTDELDAWLEDKLSTPSPADAPSKGRGHANALPTLPRWNKRLIAALSILSAAGALAVVLLAVHNAKVDWANDVAIPEIERLVLTPEKERAYDLAARVERIVPGSSRLRQLMPLVSGSLSFETDPPGADLSVRPYGSQASEWQPLGRTPVSDLRLSAGPKRWRIERPGYATAEGSAQVRPGEPEKLRITLTEASAAPEGMVRVPGDTVALIQFQVRFSPRVKLGDFWLDRFEVSNRQYRSFVDAGGYADRRYWKHPFERDGRTLGWEESMAAFVDRTGKPGPATWESGACPAGRDDEPVTGISWYEAAAFAEFAGKRLPSVYHWSLAAGILTDTDYVIPASNFDGRALAPVGAYKGLGPFGTYDLAGNAKEWCSNEAGGRRANLGGAWNEAQYASFAFDSYPAFLRSDNFGFRCMKPVTGAEGPAPYDAPLKITPEPDYAAMTPCPDAVFEAYRSLYGYAKTALDPRVESRQDWSADTVLEKVSFLDAGGGERIYAYIFLPRRTPPPYQSIVYFPGSSALQLDSVFEYGSVKSREIELYTRKGRAFVFPVFWNTFERRVRPLPPRDRRYLRDRMIRHDRELSRVLDYVETRPDLDPARIAYQGLSWGAYAAPVHLALEKRFRAAILVGGGFYWETYVPELGSPEWDPVHFASRVKVPLLMQNGRYDAFYPLETNARLLFRLFGTPDKDKHLIVYPTGHSVWLLNEHWRDTFGFLDRYLGPVVK